MAVALVAVSMLMGCRGTDPEPTEAPDDAQIGIDAAPDVPAPQYILDVRRAVDLVEAELGAPQRFFEVTSNPQFTNVFVALDDGTAAVAYAFVEGELQPPAPKQPGATGNTFLATDIDFVEDRILSGVTADLPNSEIDAVSVYGDGFGTTYVLAASSSVGGFLDIVVGPDGAIFSVDPV